MSENTRIAVVTGAARGIGAATAKRLAEDGYAVGVLDLSAEACADTVAAIACAGGVATAVAVDVANEESVRAAVATVADVLGHPTILVNNAGIIRDNLLFKMTTDDWDAVVNVNLRGAFLMTSAMQGYMTKAGFGRIVNLSSTSALGNRGQANYAASKAGIEGLTKTLAIELGKFGVTVNAVAPGYIKSDMTAATAARVGVPFDTFLDSWVEQVAVRRIGLPEDVAEAVSFFCRASASFVSGQVLFVAGGPFG